MLLRACKLFVVAILTLFNTARCGHAQFVEVPPLGSLVTDQVRALAGAAPRLEETLRALKAEKGSEIAVLIVPSTKPETIEQYSIRVVEQWKLGRKGIDDGALLLVATQDRTVRIEVGRGLEGDLTDLKANRIIQEQILPRFKAGDIPGGIEAGVSAIVGVIRGVDLPQPKVQDDDTVSLLVQYFFIAISLGIFFSVPFGKGIGTSISLIIAFCLTALTISVLLAIPFALGCGLFVFYTEPANRRRGGYYQNQSGNSFGDGGAFGGGGTFGGGGSFSGGGASGRW